MVTIELDKYNALCSELYHITGLYDDMVKQRDKAQALLFKVKRALIENKISDYTIKMYDYNENDLYDVCSGKYPISYTDYIALRDLGIAKEEIVSTVIDRIAEIKERERNE